MSALRRNCLRVTADAIHPGTTVRYYYRDGDSLATVTGKTDRHISFVGDGCDGTFTHEQIGRLLDDGRLRIVLGGDTRE